MLAAYVAAGGAAVPLPDVIFGLIMVKFETNAHHGPRYLRGEASQATVTGQLAKIRAVLKLSACR